MIDWWPWGIGHGPPQLPAHPILRRQVPNDLCFSPYPVDPLMVLIWFVVAIATNLGIGDLDEDVMDFITSRLHEVGPAYIW